MSTATEQETETLAPGIYHGMSTTAISQRTIDRRTFAAGIQPGVYYDMPFDDYKALPCLNSGALRKILISPKHCRAAMDGLGDTHDTKAMQAGRAFHCALLEPERWADYLISKQCCVMTKDGKGSQCSKHGTYYHGDSLRLWACKAHSGKALIPNESCTPEQQKNVEAMKAAIAEHDVCKLLHMRGGHEVVIIWDEVIPYVMMHGVEVEHCEAVVRCKCRIDKLIIDGAASQIIDLKSCQVEKATEYECRRSIENFNYMFQGFMYRRAVQSVHKVNASLFWVFVESGPPFDVCVIQADDTDIDIARGDYERALQVYAKSLHDNKWIGRHPKTVLEALPAWRRKQEE